MIASPSARKSRIRLPTHKNQWIFTFFLFSRRRKARSKARNREQKKHRKRHPKSNKKSLFFSIFHLSGANSHKTSKNHLPEPPRAPPPGEGKGSKIDLKAAKSSPRWTLDAPKNTFWAFSKKIRATFFRSERPPEPHLPPRTPREASRALH